MPKPTSAIKAVVITTASPEKEASKSSVKAKCDLIGMGVGHVDFFDFEYESPQALGKYDAVFLNGGNRLQLLYWLKKSGGIQIIKELAQQETVIVGASAGAMVLGKNIEIAVFFAPELNTMRLMDLGAIGLTEKLLFPHYDREDLFPDGTGRTIEERIKRFEFCKNATVVRLKDHEYLSMGQY